MIVFMKAVGADGERHKPSQFPVVSVFFGETRSVIYQMWVIVWFKSRHHQIKKH